LRHHLFGAALVGALSVCGCALAGGQETAPAPPVQTAPADPSAAPAPAASACCVIPAGTLITVELTQPLSAEKAKGGDVFGLKLSEPIMIGDVTLVPAGATGQGEVIDAKPAGIGGRPGRLVLAARYLDVGGQKLKLQSLKLSGGGKDRSELAVGAVIAVGVLGALVPGGGVDYPAGTLASAKIAIDFTAPSPVASPAAPAEPPAAAPAAPATPSSN
jgi:hypothetical protein